MVDLSISGMLDFSGSLSETVSNTEPGERWRLKKVWTWRESGDGAGVVELQIVGVCLPHVVLLGISVGYAVAGATAFRWLEGSSAEAERAERLRELAASKEQLVDRLIALSTDQGPITEGQKELGKFVRSLYRIHQTGLLNHDDLGVRVASKLQREAAVYSALSEEQTGMGCEMEDSRLI